MTEKSSQQQKMLLLCPFQEMGANKYKRDKAPGEDHSSEVIIKNQVVVTSEEWSSPGALSLLYLFAPISWNGHSNNIFCC